MIFDKELSTPAVAGFARNCAAAAAGYVEQAAKQAITRADEVAAKAGLVARAAEQAAESVTLSAEVFSPAEAAVAVHEACEEASFRARSVAHAAQAARKALTALLEVERQLFLFGLWKTERDVVRTNWAARDVRFAAADVAKAAQDAACAAHSLNPLRDIPGEERARQATHLQDLLQFAPDEPMD